ncbi:hypothetical protein J1614_008364 [Plenodomus biglobosus]|nr:hypothetical protein J1614_008364 [Plenodomus biglobosus]
MGTPKLSGGLLSGMPLTYETLELRESADPLRLKDKPSSVTCSELDVDPDLCGDADADGDAGTGTGTGAGAGVGSGASLSLPKRSWSRATSSSARSRSLSTMNSSVPSTGLVGRVGNERAPERPGSCCGVGDSSLMSSSASTTSSPATCSSSSSAGDGEPGISGVWPAYSLFAAGSGDRRAWVGGGEATSSSPSWDGEAPGIGRPRARSGLFPRRSNNVGPRGWKRRTWVLAITDCDLCVNMSSGGVVVSGMVRRNSGRTKSPLVSPAHTVCVLASAYGMLDVHQR